MIQLLPLIIFIVFMVDATLAVSFLVRFALEKKPRFELNPWIYIIFASSFVWSFGMGIMSLQVDDTLAYYWRTIGIFGTFVFMISVQSAMCVLAEIKGKLKWLLNIVALLGIPIFFAYSQPGQTIFVHNSIGTTFYFKEGFVNTIYSLYFFLVSVNIFLSTINIVRHSNVKRTVNAGRRLILVELCIFVGAVFDMIVPSLGKAALPGSAITHFWGVLIFWLAVHENYKSLITTSNMSEYVYHSLNTPILIFNPDFTLEVLNNASIEYFWLKDYQLSKTIKIGDLFETDDDIFDFKGQSIVSKAVCKINHANCEIGVNKIIDKYDDVTGYICLVTDMTEHDLIISRLEQAKLAADSANMTKSMFLANMSHEIRTPLNAILGFSNTELMKDVDAESRERFSDIHESGQVLLSVINQILDFSKIEVGKLDVEEEEYKASKLIEDVRIITGSNASKKGLEFSVDAPKDMPDELVGDINKIREILLNILGNAVKYTDEGSVKLTVDYNEIDDKNILLKFSIKDTGVGIKEEDIGKIFDKFSRLDSKLNSATEGTGLGLSITKGLIEILKGTITINSEYGKGSEFVVQIPQKKADKSKNELLEADSKSDIHTVKISAEGKRFLVVDDNKVNLKVSSMFLSNYGATIDTCASGKESIDKCSNTLYDIVFMDQMMPEMDGIDAMHLIRELPGYELGSEHKIVALTANAINDVKENLLAQGFDDYISKPIIKEELEGVLLKWNK